MLTIHDLFLEGKRLLNNVPDPSLESRLLILGSLGITEESFYSHPERAVSPAHKARFFRQIARRRKGIPLAYVLGEKEFWSIRFRVSPGVLIPRPETELLVEKVIELSSKKKEIIVDIGTGAGNIAIPLARELHRARIIATDTSKRALKQAKQNARIHEISTVEFVQGSFFAPLKRRGLQRKVEIISSNPPYISEKEWEMLPEEIKNHEPKGALVAGESGLEMIKKLIREAPGFLRPGGYLCLEMGWNQKEKVLSFFGDAWQDLRWFRDLNGVPRVVTARTVQAPS